MRNLLLCLAVLLSGCTGYVVRDHSLQFNEAIADLNSKMILLNAVRSSKDLPMQFSKLSTYQGSGGASASLGGKFPFGKGPTGINILSPIFEADPSLSVASSVTQLTLVDLNTAEAQTSLRKSVDSQTYGYYKTYEGTRNDDLIDLLFIEGITVDIEIFRKINAHALEKCSHPNGPTDNYLCQYIKEFGEACGKNPWDLGNDNIGTYVYFDQDTHKGKSKDIKAKAAKFVSFVNDLSSGCSYRTFYAGMAKLQLAAYGIIRYKAAAKEEKKPKVNFNIYASTPPEAGGTADGGTKEKDAYNFSFGPDAALAEMVKRDVTESRKKGKKVFDITFRSPESMVRYLGNMIALQMYRDGYIPTVNIGDGQAAPMFVVKRGSDGSAGAAVTVVDSEGESFYIPRPDYADRKHDLSLQAISIVADVLNGAVSAKSLPQVSSFTLTPTAAP